MKSTLRRWSAKDIGPGTKVLVRIECNVPLSHGRLTESGPYGRIAQALPELQALRKRGAALILMAHLGDPKGGYVPSLSLAPVARALSRALHCAIPLLPLPPSEKTRDQCSSLRSGEVVMLENLRFSPGEEKNTPRFARALAELADVGVQNAFGVIHRAHASTVGVAKYLPWFAGELVAREVAALSEKKKPPFLLILGGAKLATKLPLLEALADEVEEVCLAGAACFPFLLLQNTRLPALSQKEVSTEDLRAAKRILRLYGADRLHLPEDLLLNAAHTKVLDVGPKTVEAFAFAIEHAHSLFWNGPLGRSELAEGRGATLALAALLAKHPRKQMLLGGGDTVTVLEQYGTLEGFSHVSTGGGATLAYLAERRQLGLIPLYT